MKFLHDPLRRVAKREIKSCCGCKRFQAPALTSPPITGHERRTVTRFSCWTTYFVAVKSQPSAMLGRPIRATGWPLQTCILQNDISYPILSYPIPYHHSIQLTSSSNHSIAFPSFLATINQSEKGFPPAVAANLRNEYAINYEDEWQH